MFNDIICKLSSDPTLKTIGIVLLVLIGLMFVKRIAKIVKWLIVVLIIFAVFWFFTTDNAGEKAKDMLKKGGEQIQQLKDNPDKVKNDIENTVKEKAEEIKEKAEDEIKEKTGQD